MVLRGYIGDIQVLATVLKPRRGFVPPFCDLRK